MQAKTLAEFIKLAQSKPNSMNFGSGNVTAHVAQEAFFQTAKIKLTHIPYRGSGPSVAAAVGGEVQTLFSGPGAAIPQIKSGKLRGLAVTTAKRTPQLPELPTLAEEGVKGFSAANWWGILFPTGVQQSMVDKVSNDLGRALADAQVKERLGALGVEAVHSNPQQFGAFLASENETWGKLIKEAGISGIQ